MNGERKSDERKLWYEGPNYTADAVIIDTSSDTILLIQRNDTGQWALPGGFIDNEELPLAAARREVAEETGAIIETGGTLIYQGVVEDPRNSSNAWIETSAYLFSVDHRLEVTGLDDARNAAWRPLNNLPELYGSHQMLIDYAFGARGSGV